MALFSFQCQGVVNCVDVSSFIFGCCVDLYLVSVFGLDMSQCITKYVLSVVNSVIPYTSLEWSMVVEHDEA